MTPCHNCGERAGWRDDDQGVARCVDCLITHGGGRRHSLLPGDAPGNGPATPPAATADAGGLPGRPGAGEPAGATQEPHTIDAVPGGDAEGGVESGFDPDFRKQSVWLNLEWWWDHAADDADREECFRAAMGFGRRSDSRLALAEKRFREFDPFAEEAGE